MSALELLEQAKAEDILLLLVDGQLIWEANHQPTISFLAQLNEHKPAIIEALSTPPAQAWEWLERLANLLGCSSSYLLDHGFVDRHDLIEQHQWHPRSAAKLIRSHPDWRQPTAVRNEHAQAEESCELELAYHTAGIVSPAWIAARDAFHAHALGGCPQCHPALGRYCEQGVELRANYDQTAWS